MWSKWQRGVKDTFFPVVTFKPCLVKSSQCSKWKGQLCWVNEEKNDLTKRQRSATNHVPISWQLSVVLLWFINKCTDFCSFPTLDRVNKKNKKQNFRKTSVLVVFKVILFTDLPQWREEGRRKKESGGDTEIIALFCPPLLSSVQCPTLIWGFSFSVLSVRQECPTSWVALVGRSRRWARWRSPRWTGTRSNRRRASPRSWPFTTEDEKGERHVAGHWYIYIFIFVTCWR